MNNTALTQNVQPTMTSREIAELTDKRHDNVKADIQKMLIELEKDVLMFQGIYFDSMNRKQTEYHLDRDLTDCLLTGYSAKARMAVIKRWRELEGYVATPSFQVPQSMAEALRLAADQAERIEQQQAAIEQARPSVEFVERYVSADSGNKGFRQVAKLLKANERDLRAFLADHKIMYRLGGEWMPYQNHIDAGRFVVKTGVAENEHAFNTAKFTPKGVNWLASLWNGQSTEVAA
ncbi:phage antirepressor KilAC domain-containing protein [Vreelandella populi]|uniref:phage antirepressor KilAC domain-containing protein n=1 Tax=Vreelandella populi TaxID=2498858 RepID=UPI000F8C6B5D|nr:phage antirepressor KilAC domain-containing protein [Halomonas populi]RUR38514.1 hypothetical protein ELY25_09120 [Halomonas populi]